MSESNVVYATESDLKAQEFQQVLKDSGLGRRPIGDLERLQRMIDNSNLIVTARIDNQLVGIARSVTDWSYCCYLSDLAVSKDHQGKGIGKELLNRTRELVGNEVSLVLLAAPGVGAFYEKASMDRQPNCFIFPREI